MKITLCLAFAAIAAASGRAETPEAALSRVLSNKMLLFEPVPDTNGYRSRTASRQISIEPTGWEVLLNANKHEPMRFSMRLTGAASDAESTPSGEVHVESRDHRERPDAPAISRSTFRRVTWANVLQGIDISYSGTERNQLAFDLLLAADANVSVFRMHFTGQDRLALDSSGRLVIEKGEERLILEFPRIYQQRDLMMTVIPGRYRVDPDGDVRLDLGPYGRRQAALVLCAE